MNVVVVGLITCERVVVHSILEDEVDGHKERQGDKREDDEEGEESGVVEERAIRHNDHNAHEAWTWWNECGPKLEPCVCMYFDVKTRRVRCGVHTKLHGERSAKSAGPGRRFQASSKGFHVGLVGGDKRANAEQEQPEHVNAQARPPLLKPGANEAREDRPGSRERLSIPPGLRKRCENAYGL